MQARTTTDHARVHGRVTAPTTPPVSPTPCTAAASTKRWAGEMVTAVVAGAVVAGAAVVVATVVGAAVVGAAVVGAAGRVVVVGTVGVVDVVVWTGAGAPPCGSAPPETVVVDVVDGTDVGVVVDEVDGTDVDVVDEGGSLVVDGVVVDVVGATDVVVVASSVVDVVVEVEVVVGGGQTPVLGQLTAVSCCPELSTTLTTPPGPGELGKLTW